jgi:hypothetical protein
MIQEILTSLLSFIGSFLGGVIGYIWREKARRKAKHFEDIKMECLSPLKRELSKIRGCFEWSESRPPPRAFDIEKSLSSEIRWWDYYSLKKEGGLFFEDLANHFGNLYSKLIKIDEDFKKKYPCFLKATANLKNKLYKDARVRELCPGTDLSRPDIGISDPYIVDAIFYLSIKYDKGYWPNIYTQLKNNKELYEICEKIAEDYMQSNEAETIRSISKEMITEIEYCLKKIDEILHMAKLKGKCKYLR